MRQLDYQDRVLKAVDAYLEKLKSEKVKADQIAKLAAENPDLDLPLKDFPAEAWTAFRQTTPPPKSRASVPYSPRSDGCGRPVPNITLKVPTGGGKTWLAVNAVSRIMGRYLSTNHGFVLWIVPNQAIYAQTLKALKDRQHPYRQALDRAAAGRVKIMEKDDRLDARDVEASLCVMVLMLQSANRQDKETLKIFRDRGDVAGFTPPEGEQQRHAQLLADIPNLERYDLADGVAGWAMVKDSLGNALRIIRPVVVMDEGQKAVSALAYSTLYGFNPSFVLELSATPKDVKEKTIPATGETIPARTANVLVEVTGVELDKEGMIKMPLNLHTKQGNDWKTTLASAIETLDSLKSHAETLRADTKRYIRPVLLIQVERTGKETRGGEFIHSEDVKDWLLGLGYLDAQIAIKTAETNDLNQPENLDLLAPTNQVRFIITKQALQEGWDCPFAYVLCSLAASSNLSAMTQLVGRILRQPQGMKTGIDTLDECYVFTHQAQTADVVAKIKDGLEKDGLGDLVLTISSDEGASGQKAARAIPRKAAFSNTQIWLPKVMTVDAGELREFDYEADLLPLIDWAGFDVAGIVSEIPENPQAATSQIQRIRVTDDEDERLANTVLASSTESSRFDPAYAVRSLSDIVSNPFIARELVGKVLLGLTDRGFDKPMIDKAGGVIIDTMRKRLMVAQMELAETAFKHGVSDGRIQFRLRADGRNWKLPDETWTMQPEGAAPLLGEDATGVKNNLFEKTYADDFNGEERDVAVYLDKDDALIWWHRNVARKQYGLPGWRRGRIFPDFIFAANRDGGGKRITVLETKGDQLGNMDTAYKRALLAALSASFTWDTSVDAGQMQLVQEDGTMVDCTLIMMQDIAKTLPEYLE